MDANEEELKPGDILEHRDGSIYLLKRVERSVLRCVPIIEMDASWADHAHRMKIEFTRVERHSVTKIGRQEDAV